MAAAGRPSSREVRRAPFRGILAPMSSFGRGRVGRALARTAAPTVAAALSVAPVAADESPWHLGVEASTDVPMSVGGRASLEGPLRLRLTTGFGVLPEPYVALTNAVAVGLGGYDQATADVVESAIASSFVWRTQLGWRFVPEWGFYADLGYTLVTLGGGASAAELLALSTGEQAPPEAQSKEFDVASTLHMFVIEAGYEWVLVEHLVLRGALGFAATLGATTSVEEEFAVGALERIVVDAFAARSERYLNDVYTSYVFTPVITAGVGYRFF
jgi:hypothetical protein